MYTRDLRSACERVAKGCKQCQANIPKNQKAEGLLKGLPIPERLFDKVTADVFELVRIQEECLYTRKPIDGVLLIQDRHSGYIQVLPCNTKHLTSEMAAKWTASQWMSNWDVPSEILTDSGNEFIGTWWENMCALWLSLSVFRLVPVMVSLVVQMVGGGKGDPYPGVVVAFGRRWCFRWCS